MDDDRLQAVFRDVFDDDDLTLADEMTAADIPGWDSLAHINLMFALEAEFGVLFEGDQLAQLADIGELKQFLAERAAAR